MQSHPVDDMVLEEMLTETEGSAAARVSMCFVIEGPGIDDVCGGCIGSDRARFCRTTKISTGSL
jgi:hypothetical protein